jgi:HEAT repeat protein
MEMVADPAESVRSSAISALGEIGTPEALAALKRALWDEELGPEAAVALQEAAAKECIPALADRLGGPAPRTRMILALGELGARGHAHAIVPFLDAAEPNERWAAILALARLDAAAHVTRIRQLLDDWDPDVRAAAAYACGALGDSGAASDLAARLQDPKVQVRMAAAEGLGLLGNAEHARRVAGLLLDRDEFVREKAARAIGKMCAREFIPQLISILSPFGWSSAESRVIVAVCDALGELRAGEAIPHLVRRLRHDDEKVRVAAARALGAVGDRRAVAPLRRELECAADSAVIDAIRASLEQLEK